MEMISKGYGSGSGDEDGRGDSSHEYNYFGIECGFISGHGTGRGSGSGVGLSIFDGLEIWYGNGKGHGWDSSDIDLGSGKINGIGICY